MSNRLCLSIVVLNLGPRDDETVDVAQKRLHATLQSLRDQGLDHKDEVIVVMKAEYSYARTEWLKSGLSGIIIRTDAERFMKAGYERAGGDAVLTCRDGDEWMSGAIQHIRDTITPARTYGHFFRTALSLIDGAIADVLARPNKILCPMRGTISHDGMTVLKNFYYDTRSAHCQEQANVSEAVISTMLSSPPLGTNAEKS